ncbi:hypothetical protein FALBO_5266 [Fusarium albosuccineum]|uniref:N-acetyltransferase domain-containing protein n=1 Tax=Fusarium albosuccineum TaxID=1237068 RepID=A0A8H4PFM7_9HYPO|nr:hypothetical protein FALBO_5266 [Fusarium albosuccineum]
MPMTSKNGTVVKRVVSIGVWDIAPETRATGGGSVTFIPQSHFEADLSADRGIKEKRDANLQYMRSYAAAAAQGFRDHFDKYGNDQLNLWMLATRPEYRWHGAGTMLCN